MEKQIIERLDKIILLGTQVLASVKLDPLLEEYVDHKLLAQYRTAGQSFLMNVFGADSPYYKEFKEQVNFYQSRTETEVGQGILQGAKEEIQNGGLISIKKLVMADLFADFLEMAEYLLSENYKDASAVMIGSVLEEHLRKLCDTNKISVINPKDGKPKKADTLNGELGGQSVYDKLDLKNITAWLDLRNKAAHGKYSEYNSDQVKNMLNGVSEFIARTK
jgi:hypothetical protein